MENYTWKLPIVFAIKTVFPLLCQWQTILKNDLLSYRFSAHPVRKKRVYLSQQSFNIDKELAFSLNRKKGHRVAYEWQYLNREKGTGLIDTFLVNRPINLEVIFDIIVRVKLR